MSPFSPFAPPFTCKLLLYFVALGNRTSICLLLSRWVFSERAKLVDAIHRVHCYSHFGSRNGRKRCFIRKAHHL